MRKKKQKLVMVDSVEEKPIEVVLPFGQFFDQMVFKDKVREDQKAEVESFFRSKGLKVKESLKTFEAELKNY